MKQTASFFSEIINVCAVHSELFLRSETPLLTNLLSSVLSVYSCTFGIENGLAWYG